MATGEESEDGTSMFSDAHHFNTHGSLFNSAARDLHVHYCTHTGRGDDSEHQSQTASTSPPVPRPPSAVTETVNEERTVTDSDVSGRLGASLWSWIPFLGGWFRPQLLETEVVDVVEAEYTSLLSRSSSSVAPMIPKDSEVYLRLMLKHKQGYPLYRPEPNRGLPMEYRKKGVSIDDVGRITPDGAFDFLFNIDSSQASLVNPSILPKDFETIPPIGVLSNDYFHPGEHLLSDHVKQTKDTPITYKFLAAEGAVLQVPEGATIFEAENINVSYEIAARHAENWYEYMIANRSRDVPNGSLYLVTGCIKTGNWGIGSLYGQPSETDYLEFTSGSQSSQRPYRWKKSGPIMTKVGPTSTDITTTDGEEPNQCVFLRGYKITLGGKLWKELKGKALSVPSNRAHSFRPSRTSINNSNTQYGANQSSLTRGTSRRLSSGHVTHSTIPDSPADRELHHTDLENSDRSEVESGRILFEEFFSVASPMHPLDLVNVMIMRVEPEAKVVLVHDNEWCNSLPENFGANPRSLKIKDFLDNIASSCVAAVDQNGCVLLVRKSTVDFHQLDDAQYIAREPRQANDSVPAHGQRPGGAPSSPGKGLNARNRFNISQMPTVVQQSHGRLGSVTQEELPSDCATGRGAFRYVPPELVEWILNWLDLPSMLRCRYVCSAFRRLIDSSPYFQWNIELAIAGSEDSGDYPLPESRRMLAQHQKGWADLHWTNELFIRVRRPRDHTLVGGVLGQISDDGSTMHFKRLPSQSRNIEERDWTVDIRMFNKLVFAIDPAQDLFIIAAVPESWQGRYNYRICLLTLSTGDPHPLASGLHILTHALSHMHRRCGIRLCEDIFVVVFDIWEGTEIVFWNWKTGSVLGNVASDHPTAVAFLSPNHVIFGVQKPKEPRLIVVDITMLTPERQRLEKVENRFTFHLPPFADTVQEIDINIRSEDAPACKSNPEFPVPFFTARQPRNRLHLVTLLVRTGYLFHQVHLYALSHSFLSLIDMAAGQNTADFDWRMWGPEGTRMMLTSSMSSRSAMGPSTFPSGARHVSTGRPATQPVDRIHIYDFNQYALRRSDKSNKQENAADEGDAKTSLPYANVMAPTTIVEDELFQGEIETRLGYRTKCWVIPGEPKVRYPLCVGDAFGIWEEEYKGYRIFTA